RSLHGCWTCRLRRKKCDETRPVCTTCISLELECHGYGPRPEWMDRGVLQREQAFKVKRILSQTISNRRKRRVHHKSYISNQDIHGYQEFYKSTPRTYPLSSAKTFGHISPGLAPGGEPNIFGQEEDVLFMHYLDEVFFIQYPYYHAFNNQGRGWLYSLLRCVKSAYYATLALSEHHRYLTLQSNNRAVTTPHPRDNAIYYNLALQAMQLSIGESHNWSGATSLTQSIEALSCILQLLFRELLGTNKDNWKMHLNAAAALIPTLVQSHTPLLSPNCGASQSNALTERPTTLPCVETDTAVKFLLGSFISLDVIACASIRSTPFLELDHKSVLETAGIPLADLVGYENWVMVVILEISKLDNWKRESENARRLSMVELVNRGNHIEKRLKEKLAIIESTVSARELPGKVVGSTSTGITKIFALSATTYLHAVLSGANPELPEIRSSVLKTIVAFQNLTDSKLLQKSAWAFAITGCLAVEEQYTLFRDIILAADIKTNIGPISEAIMIMEDCWQMRKTFSGNCDWVSAMMKRGHQTLL
ncbi:fungal-specific transcription factor domain-containing protein, partial [Xylogone sp. PMI_703]